MEKALAHLQHDPIIKALIDSYPEPTFTRHNNYYQELVSSIISQQLSVKAAQTIELRFIELFDNVFPSPEQILMKDVETLRAVGISRPKATYIQDLAVKVIEGTIDFNGLDSLSNEEIVAELTKIKGIGVWTAHMFLLFCMARLDVLPTGDLGIKNGITTLYKLDHQATEEDIKMIATANRWHPFESVASWYIWQSLNNKSNY